MADAPTGFVPVYVREEFLSSVHELVADLEAGKRSEKVPTPAKTNGVPREDIVRTHYSDGSEGMKAVLRRLAESPGTEIAGNDLAKAVGPHKHSGNLAGIFGAHSKWVRPVSEVFGSRWDPARNNVVYVMDPDVAKVVKSIK